jgi:hypothetical protein
MTTATWTMQPVDRAGATEQLTRLKWHATDYEVTMSDGLNTVLLGYTDRKGRAGIWGLFGRKERAVAAAKVVGTQTLTFGKRAKDGATAGRWTINFSGRTLREAIASGEYPYCETIAVDLPMPAA